MTEQSKNAILNFIADDVAAQAKNLNKDTKDRDYLLAKASNDVAALRSNLKYGIIRTDYEYTPTRGDPGAPESFTSTSMMLKVEGWTFEAVQRGIRGGKYPAGEIMIKDRFGKVDEAYGWKLWNNFPETGGSWKNRNEADYKQVTTKPADGYFHQDDYKLGTVYRYSPEAIERNMKKTIKRLEDAGVCGISADVGYSQAFQESVRKMTKVPVALSSLQQLPFLSAMYDLSKENKNMIMVMTANGDSFLDNLDKLLPPGTDRDTIKIVGSLGKDFGDSRFGEWVRDGNSLSRFREDAFDDASVEEGLESMIDRCAEGIEAVEKDGFNVVCVVLECAEMPAYSNGLRLRFGLPVYDTFTAIEFVQAGRGFGQYSAYMMMSQPLNVKDGYQFISRSHGVVTARIEYQNAPLKFVSSYRWYLMIESAEESKKFITYGSTVTVKRVTHHVGTGGPRPEYLPMKGVNPQTFAIGEAGKWNEYKRV